MPQTTHLASTRLRGGWAVLAAIVMLATAGATDATAPAAGSARIPAFATVARDTAPTAADLGRALGENVLTGAPVESLPAPRAAVTAPVTAPVVVKKATVLRSPTPTIRVAAAVVPRYTGRNHMWMPALGINRTVYSYPCTRSTPPDNLLYRWGCAGANNVYLLGHAWGVFAKIDDGYHSGALHAGLTAWYADKAGRVHQYRISWVRHVRNADYASWSQWAMAATSGPVITLQTCDGATSAYRILVRLVPA